MNLYSPCEIVNRRMKAAYDILSPKLQPQQQWFFEHRTAIELLWGWESEDKAVYIIGNAARVQVAVYVSTSDPVIFPLLNEKGEEHAAAFLTAMRELSL